MATASGIFGHKYSGAWVSPSNTYSLSAVKKELVMIQIGPRTTISQYAPMCAGTYDFRRANRPLPKPLIATGTDAYIAAEAQALASGRDPSFVTKDIVMAHAVAGNPARTIGTLDT